MFFFFFSCQVTKYTDRITSSLKWNSTFHWTHRTKFNDVQERIDTTVTIMIQSHATQFQKVRVNAQVDFSDRQSSFDFSQRILRLILIKVAQRGKN